MGTSSDKNTLLASGQAVYTTQSLSSGSGSFSASVGALEPGKTYYYVAFMEVLEGGSYKTVYPEEVKTVDAVFEAPTWSAR